MVQTKKKPFYFLKNKKKILDIQNLKKLYYQTLQSLKKLNPEELNQLEKKYNNNKKNNNKLNILFSIFNNFNSNEYIPFAPNNLSKVTIKELIVLIGWLSKSVIKKEENYKIILPLDYLPKEER